MVFISDGRKGVVYIMVFLYVIYHFPHLISGFFSSFLVFSSLNITCLRVVFFVLLFLEAGLESLWFSSNLRKFSTINS